MRVGDRVATRVYDKLVRGTVESIDRKGRAVIRFDPTLENKHRASSVIVPIQMQCAWSVTTRGNGRVITFVEFPGRKPQPFLHDGACGFFRDRVYGKGRILCSLPELMVSDSIRAAAIDETSRGGIEMLRAMVQSLLSMP